MRDAASKRELRKYATKILRYAKDASLTIIKNQLNIIFNRVDIKFQKDLFKPDKGIIINSYLISLNDRKY